MLEKIIKAIYVPMEPERKELIAQEILDLFIKDIDENIGLYQMLKGIEDELSGLTLLKGKISALETLKEIL